MRGREGVEVLVVLVTCCLLGAAGGVASAAPPAAVPTEVRATVSWVHREFGRGLGHMRQREWQQAASLFAVLELSGLKNALWNLAECHRHLGRPAQAIAILRRYGLHPRTTPEERRAATAVIAELWGQVGRLTVTASLAGAEVRIDGREGGRSPHRAELDPGPHVIEVVSPGYRAERREVRLGPGEQQALAVQLEQEPAILSLETRPAAARLQVAGRPAGPAPAQLQIRPGSVSVEALAAGYRPQRRTITLLPGQHTRLVLTLPEEVALLSVDTGGVRGQVRLDGRLLGPSPLVARRLVPGIYRLEVEGVGHDPYRSELVVRDDESAAVAVVLRRGRRHPAWALAAAGVGAVLLGAGGGLWVEAQRSDDRVAPLLRDLDLRRLPPAQVPEARARATGLALERDRRREQATALLISGGVALVSAAVLAVFTRWTRSEGRVQIRRLLSDPGSGP